jgi:uncharacterized membrane protein YfcA
MNPHLVLIALPILAAGGIFSAVAGGGLAIITMLVLSFLGFEIHQSVALSAMLGTAIQLAKLFHFRGHVRWNIALWYCVLGIPASFAGGMLLFWVPGRTLEVVVGLVILLMGVTEAFPLPKLPKITSPTPAVLLPLGALNGFLGGIVGNASLIRAPALMSMGLRKNDFIGTSTVIALPMNLAKLVPYTYGIVWSPQVVQLFVLLIPTLFLSVALGKRLLHYCPVRAFELLQAGILIVGAIKLLFFP